MASSHNNPDPHPDSEEDPSSSSSDANEDDDVWDDNPTSDSTYDRQIAEKNWNRLHDRHGVVGYKEGISEGREVGMQTGFDEGIESGVGLGERVGWCGGALSALLVFFEARTRVSAIGSSTSPPSSSGSVPATTTSSAISESSHPSPPLIPPQLLTKLNALHTEYTKMNVTGIFTTQYFSEWVVDQKEGDVAKVNSRRLTRDRVADFVKRVEEVLEEAGWGMSMGIAK